MSVETIQKLLDRFHADVDQAIADGTGKALHARVVFDLAADRAATIFLAIDAEAADADMETVDEAGDRVERLIRIAAADFAASVTEPLEAAGATEAQCAEAERLATDAFGFHLGQLIQGLGARGSA